MFDYSNFKKEMIQRGHAVRKKGNRITIYPNMSLKYPYFEDIIDGYNQDLKFLYADHYNDTVYEAKFKMI